MKGGNAHGNDSRYIKFIPTPADYHRNEKTTAHPKVVVFSTVLLG